MTIITKKKSTCTDRALFEAVFGSLFFHKMGEIREFPTVNVLAPSEKTSTFQGKLLPTTREPHYNSQEHQHHHKKRRPTTQLEEQSRPPPTGLDGNKLWPRLVTPPTALVLQKGKITAPRKVYQCSLHWHRSFNLPSHIRSHPDACSFSFCTEIISYKHSPKYDILTVVIMLLHYAVIH